MTDPDAAYNNLLTAMRNYVIGQHECGYPARLQDLREFRTWKNMPHDSEYDAALLREINGDVQP